MFLTIFFNAKLQIPDFRFRGLIRYFPLLSVGGEVNFSIFEGSLKIRIENNRLLGSLAWCRQRDRNPSSAEVTWVKHGGRRGRVQRLHTRAWRLFSTL